jgi:hypothetical protein
MRRSASRPARLRTRGAISDARASADGRSRPAAFGVLARGSAGGFRRRTAEAEARAPRRRWAAAQRARDLRRNGMSRTGERGCARRDRLLPPVGGVRNTFSSSRQSMPRARAAREHRRAVPVFRDARRRARSRMLRSVGSLRHLRSAGRPRLRPRRYIGCGGALRLRPRQHVPQRDHHHLRRSGRLRSGKHLLRATERWALRRLRLLPFLRGRRKRRTRRLGRDMSFDGRLPEPLRPMRKGRRAATTPRSLHSNRGSESGGRHRP